MTNEINKILKIKSKQKGFDELTKAFSRLGSSQSIIKSIKYFCKNCFIKIYYK